uniref:Uncharacterized protein n=1 Tax=Salix viminalis TaxID=40686 RepID=A0A6N2NJW5_SALVM
MVKIQLTCLISFMDLPELVLLPQQAAREMVSILQGQVIETSSFVENKALEKISIQKLKAITLKNCVRKSSEETGTGSGWGWQRRLNNNNNNKKQLDEINQKKVMFGFNGKLQDKKLIRQQSIAPSFSPTN